MTQTLKGVTHNRYYQNLHRAKIAQIRNELTLETCSYLIDSMSNQIRAVTKYKADLPEFWTKNCAISKYTRGCFFIVYLTQS